MVILMLAKCLQKAQNDNYCKQLTLELKIRNTLDPYYGRTAKSYLKR